MLWNEIDYDSQMKIIQKLQDLFLKEEDIVVREHLLAAAHELEFWTNKLGDIENHEIELPEDEYIAYIKKSYIGSAFETILSAIFGKK